MDIQCSEKLYEFHNDLPVLPDDWKLKKSKNLFNNLHDKTEYVIHMKNLNQVSNHKIILKKVHTVIKFNQNSWLKPYIDMSNNLTQNLLEIEIRKN